MIIPRSLLTITELFQVSFSTMADETEEEMLGCCADNWAVWLRFETWIWAVFLLVQVTMVVFLVIHGRSDKSFRQAFYVFFIAVTFIDCFLNVLVSKISLLVGIWRHTAEIYQSLQKIARCFYQRMDGGPKKVSERWGQIVNVS